MAKSIQAECAAAIRAELKEKFPGVKFSVTSERASMMTAVRVDWTDGPTGSAVDSIVGKYQYGHFDGMDDSYNPTNLRRDIPQVKYVTTSREISRFDDIVAELAKLNPDDSKWDLQGLANQVAGKADLTSGYLGVRRTKVRSGQPADFYEIVTGDSPPETDERCESCNKIVASRADLTVLEVGAWKPLACVECHDRKAEESRQRDEYNARASARRKQEAAVAESVESISDIDDDIRIHAKFAKLNKRDTLAEYERECERADGYHINTVRIIRVVTLSAAGFTGFSNSLMSDYDFVAGLGGSDSDYETDLSDIQLCNDKEEREKWLAQSYVLGILVTDGGRFLIANPEGYNYARYVGLVTPEPEWFAAVRELIGNSENPQLKIFDGDSFSDLQPSDETVEALAWL